jgi:hypothetical protein
VACTDDSDPDIMKHKLHFRFAAQTVIDFLTTAAPGQSSRNVALLFQISEEERNREFLFCNSELFQRSRGGNCTELSIERQLSAKLHCLYGVPIEATGRTRSSRTYPYACSKVYDLRNYTPNTIWGPYLGDGSLYVDWEKIEAIMVVIGHNLRMFSERTRNSIYESIWSKPFAAAVPDSYVSLSVPRIDKVTLPPDAIDPFNVTGTYMRVSTSIGPQCIPVLTRIGCVLLRYSILPTEPSLLSYCIPRLHRTICLQLRFRTAARQGTPPTTRYHRSGPNHRHGSSHDKN